MSHAFMAEVLKALRKGIRFTDHAFQVMYSAERMVTVDEVVEALRAGDVIEDYPTIRVGTAVLFWASPKGEGPYIWCVFRKTSF